MSLGQIDHNTLNQLENGKSLILLGFGRYEVKARSELKRLNPQSGEEIIELAARLPVF